MTNDYSNWVVDVDQLQTTLSIDHNIPIIAMADWLALCTRVAIIYDLKAKKTTLNEICECIHKFINTPFGNKVLKDLGYNVKICNGV